MLKLHSILCLSISGLGVQMPHCTPSGYATGNDKWQFGSNFKHDSFSGKQNGRCRDSVTQQLAPDILLPLFSSWLLSWTSDCYHIKRGKCPLKQYKWQFFELIFKSMWFLFRYLTRPVWDRFQDSSKSVLVYFSWLAQIWLRFHRLVTSKNIRLRKCAKIRVNTRKCARKWESMAKCAKTWESMRKCAKTWKSMWKYA